MIVPARNFESGHIEGSFLENHMRHRERRTHSGARSGLSSQGIHA